MKSTARQPRVTIFSGPRGVGKTSCVLRVAVSLAESGISVFGVATPKMFSDDEVIGLAVTDLSTGKQIQLARIDDQPGLRHGPWRFSHEGIRFANNACDPKYHKGICIVDEIGPLELRNEGFLTPVKALKAGEYAQALIVVRPELADEIAHFIRGDVALIQWEPDCYSLLMKHIERFMKTEEG